MEDINLHKLYGVAKIIPKLVRVAWKVMDILIASFNASNSVFSKVFL
jgi:hypothetical protein